MFNTTAPITLGANCSIGMRVIFITASHEIGGPAHRAGSPTAGPISVGDGAWIGAGAIVLPGVSIGAGAIVGAGSVVTQDLEPHGIYVGSPARLARRLDGVQ
ncbi:acyltransferase [Paenarthrobacter nicotinovorans]|uniref:acyltransferase n=1 Tax=Paenarthrobacter nicotinovorans TaxID=29320 RepID=UPI0037F2849F